MLCFRTSLRILALLTLLFGVSVSFDISTFKSGLYDRVTGISYQQCLEVCDKTPACRSSIYYRRYQLCEHYGTNITIIYEPGVTFNIKLEIRHLEQKQLCNCTRIQECHIDVPTNNATCSKNPKACPVATGRSLTKYFGNIVSIGSRVKEKCLNLPTSMIRTCRTNSTWFPDEELICVCNVPEHIDIPHSTITILDNGNNTFMAEFTCDTEYQLQQRRTPSCNLTTGLWSDLDCVCCVRIQSEWTKIYQMQSEITGIGIIDAFVNGFTDEYVDYSGLYRNSEIVDNWKTYNITQVKVNIINNEKVVSFLVFNGCGSNALNWFDQNRLLESSWTDLTETTPTDYLSINGISVPHLSGFQHARFFISSVVDSDNCDNDRGWLVATYSSYPCGYHGGSIGVRILYAKDNKMARLNEDELAFADRLEIWIQKM